VFEGVDLDSPPFDPIVPGSGQKPNWDKKFYPLVEKVIKHLSCFGYSPATIKTKHSALVQATKDLPRRRNHNYFNVNPGPTRFNYLYCSRCMSIPSADKGGNATNQHLVPIAYLKLEDVSQEDGQHKGRITVEQVYPHNSECCTHINLRHPTLTSKMNGGSGVSIIPFDFERIIGGTYQFYIDHIKAEYPDPQEPPPADGINTGEDSGMIDRRRYLQLPSASCGHYPVPVIIVPDRHNNTLLRLALWIINTHSLVHEFFDKEYLLTQCWAFHPNYVDWNSNVEPTKRDKYFNTFSIVLGGHAFKLVREGVYALCERGDRQLHQCPHLEEPPTMVVGKDGQRSRKSIRENPHLKGKSMPGFFMAPLEDDRTIYIRDPDDQPVTVLKSFLAKADGDVPHGGMQYIHEAGQEIQWKPCLFGHIRSIDHVNPYTDSLVFCPTPQTYLPHEYFRHIRDEDKKLIAIELVNWCDGMLQITDHELADYVQPQLEDLMETLAEQGEHGQELFEHYAIKFLSHLDPEKAEAVLKTIAHARDLNVTKRRKSADEEEQSQPDQGPATG